MDKNAKDVVDYLEQKTVEDYDPTGEIYDRILSKLVNEFPFGPTDGRYYYDQVHVILANALTASLWLGWLSQAMTNKKDQKFKAEYVELFKITIEQAYKVGRKYSSQWACANSFNLRRNPSRSVPLLSLDSMTSIFGFISN
jgi:hypothetical protein